MGNMVMCGEIVVFVVISYGEGIQWCIRVFPKRLSSVMLYFSHFCVLYSLSNENVRLMESSLSAICKRFGNLSEPLTATYMTQVVA